MSFCIFQLVQQLRCNVTTPQKPSFLEESHYKLDSEQSFYISSRGYHWLLQNSRNGPQNRDWKWIWKTSALPRIWLVSSHEDFTNEWLKEQKQKWFNLQILTVSVRFGSEYVCADHLARLGCNVQGDHSLLIMLFCSILFFPFILCYLV